MLSVRSTLSILTLLVCSPFVTTLTASQVSDSTGSSQFLKVNGIHDKITSTMADIKNGLGTTSDTKKEITSEQIAKAIASFSQLKSNHTEFITERSKLPNDGCQKLFPDLMEGVYKMGNTKANLERLEANISEQEQKLVQSLAMKSKRLREQATASSDQTALTNLQKECLALTQNCDQISNGKNFSEESKKSAAVISIELTNLGNLINIKIKQIADENAQKKAVEDAQRLAATEAQALKQLIDAHQQLDITVTAALEEGKSKTEAELIKLKTGCSELLQKFRALQLGKDENKALKATHIHELNSLSDRLTEAIKISQQTFFQRLAQKLTQKRYLVSTLVGLTVVAGLAFGEHQNKMVSRFIFGQARAPEQIVSLAPLSWWSRTRGWFSGWFSRLSWFNRIRTQGVCVK